MALSTTLANRLGFIILGLTNNFAYVIMLSAAYDLLKQSEKEKQHQQATGAFANATEPYCNEQSTSTILLADTIPSLTTKVLYPFLFVGLPTAYKAIATALLSAASFLVTGLFTDQILIFTGVACASFSSGLGESTYLSNTPQYGDVSLSGWSIGTGGAGLLGAGAYALLTMIFSIKVIMIIMLVIPIAMMFAYFKIIVPVDSDNNPVSGSSINGNNVYVEPISTLDVIDSPRQQQKSTSDDNDEQQTIKGGGPNYGAESSAVKGTAQANEENQATMMKTSSSSNGLIGCGIAGEENFNMRAKFHYLPTLSKYFLPLLLVYFAEYFINQGLFELIYYPEVSFLSHAAQYRWFQVSYQFGVLVSRSSLDVFRIKRLWTMSLLQSANALLFLAHAAKLFQIPSFYIVILIIVYEGLLGGFTYANTFYRMRKELVAGKQEFGISTVTIADTLGIVIAGLVALPVHNALCKLYV